MRNPFQPNILVYKGKFWKNITDSLAGFNLSFIEENIFINVNHPFPMYKVCQACGWAKNYLKKGRPEDCESVKKNLNLMKNTQLNTWVQN